MLIDFVATVAAGFAAGGLAMLGARLAGGRLPRWAIPAAAGAAMLGFQIWSEYTWFGRTTAALPAGIEVIATHEGTAPWRPWSYVVPQVTRFAAVDAGGAKRNEKLPGQVIATVLLFQRHGPAASVPQLVDCAGSRYADLSDGAEFAEDGRVIDANWVALGPDDPLLRALCAAPANG